MENKGSLVRTICVIGLLGLLLGHNCVFADPTIWETDFGAELGDLTGEDDAWEGVSLSFPFSFGGTDYTDVLVSTNGSMRLGDDWADLPGGTLWDNLGGSDSFVNDGHPLILPFNSDLSLEYEGRIHFNDFGNRAVFTWDEVGTYVAADQDRSAPLSFQVQLLDDSTIIFGYNGILDGYGENFWDDLNEGILVGITLGDGVDPGPSDLTVDMPFYTSTTTYEVWGTSSPGPLIGAFDLDQTNVVFIPVPGALLLGMLGLSVVGVKLRKYA